MCLDCVLSLCRLSRVSVVYVCCVVVCSHLRGRQYPNNYYLVSASVGTVRHGCSFFDRQHSLSCDAVRFALFITRRRVVLRVIRMAVMFLGVVLRDVMLAVMFHRLLSLCMYIRFTLSLSHCK